MGDGGKEVLQATKRLTEKMNAKLLVLHVAASRVGALDLGFTHSDGITSALGQAEVIYNMGMDEYDLPKDWYVIYQGSHGDNGAHRADLILPSACYTEESGIFVNTEGRSQMAFRANFPPGKAKENWAIVRALAGKLGLNMAFNSLSELRTCLINEYPLLGNLGNIVESDWKKSSFSGFSTNSKLKNYYDDFYKTNPIARASLTLNKLSKANNETGS